jgi:hypothetical protein
LFTAKTMVDDKVKDLKPVDTTSLPTHLAELPPR